MTPASPAPPRRRSPLLTLAFALAVTVLDAMLLTLALGGLTALVHHTRALALLATWLVGGLVLAFRRPDRSLTPRSTRSDSSLILLLLFAIPLVTPALSAWDERLALLVLPPSEVLRWAGVVISALGFALRIGAMQQLGVRFSPLVALQEEHRLETRGLYGVVRHPGYVGSLLVSLGAALAFGSGIGLMLVLALAIVLTIRTRREEALLAEHFGPAWQEYTRRTGAFLPRGPAR